jgi:dephospho-CoA kinase
MRKTVGAAFKLGLTGGIGSGKSTVAKLLASHGAAIVDADAIARGVTLAGGAAIAAIAQAFGPDFIAADGAMDRDKMRALAYQDPDAKRRLEAIIHPLVGQETARQAEVAERAGRACIVFDVPLLAESRHWRARVDQVLVVDCPAETQIQRVMARNGWESSAVRAVIASQAPRDKRLSCADMVLFNGPATSLEQLAADLLLLAGRFGL